MRIAIFHELPTMSGSRKAVNSIAKVMSKKNTLDLYYTDSEKTPSVKGIYNRQFFYKFKPVFWNGGNWVNKLNRDTLELVKLYRMHRKIASDINKKKYDAVFIHGSYLTESPFILQFKTPLKVYYAHAPNYTLVFERIVGIPKASRIKYAYEIVNRFIRKIIDKLNVKQSDVILANSMYTKNKISEFYKKKSLVAYLGVNVAIYKPTPIKKIYDILFIGSYGPADGYSLLHQALQLSKKSIRVKVLAIEEEWIESDQQLAHLYNRSKLVVCLAHGEPFGLVAIEAMACGVPVVAVDEAGYRETVINGRTGTLVKRQPEELLKAIESLLRSKKKYERYSQKSRSIAVERWSQKISAKRIESIIARKVVVNEV